MSGEHCYVISGNGACLAHDEWIKVRAAGASAKSDDGARHEIERLGRSFGIGSVPWRHDRIAVAHTSGFGIVTTRHSWKPSNCLPCDSRPESERRSGTGGDGGIASVRITDTAGIQSGLRWTSEQKFHRA